MYKTSSSQEGGTLYQLRNLINRRNVVSDPKNDMNACEDFFELAAKAHIVLAAIKTFRMKKIDNKPDENMFPSDTEKSEVLQVAVKIMLTDFVDLSFPVKTNKRSHSMDYVTNMAKMFLQWAYFILSSKTQSGKVMGRESCDAGSSCFFVLERQVIQITH